MTIKIMEIFEISFENKTARDKGRANRLFAQKLKI